MHRIIDDILASTKRRVDKLHPISRTPFTKRDFIGSVKAKQKTGTIPLISEVKPASPTSHHRDVNASDAAAIAKLMENGGACAISVLTESEFFKGSMDNLKAVRDAVTIPVLRKDFIIDKKQILETEADLILLIAGILGNDLCEFVDLAIECGIEPLVEVHNISELEAALLTNTNVIGINNRNLETMEIDISTTERLIGHIDNILQHNSIHNIKDNIVLISESGIYSANDAARMVHAGADAILVGTYIMKDATQDSDILNRTKELAGALK